MTARVASATLAVALVVLTWVLLHLGWYPHGQIVDYGVYQDYGDRIAHAHLVPYRDFALEYPPGALPVFVVPAWLERLDYRDVFQGLMLLCDAAAVLAVLAVAGRRAAALAAVAPLFLGSVVLSRFDFWPAALSAWALVTLVRGRRTTSAVLLGTAFAAKLWPAALAPLVLVWLWRRHGRRCALTWSAAALATAAAWFVPFTVVAPGGVGHSFHQQLARPLQLESLGASVLVAAHHVFGTSVHVVGSFGSQNLAGPGTGAAAAATSAAGALALVAVWVAFARGDATAERLLVSAAAAVAALIAFGKVFSPQFLIWLIPLVFAVRAVSVHAVLLTALVLTQVYFPRRYWDLARGLAPTESWLVLARNVVVVALFAMLTRELFRARAPRPASAAAAAAAPPATAAPRGAQPPA